MSNLKNNSQVQGRKMTAVIFIFWLRIHIRGIYYRDKKVVLYTSFINRGIFDIYYLSFCLTEAKWVSEIQK